MIILGSRSFRVGQGAHSLVIEIISRLSFLKYIVTLHATIGSIKMLY
jgi:hypothetical protein